MSDHFLNDCMDLAHEQGWRIEKTRGGSFRFLPPRGKVQPGYEIIHVYDGRHEPRWRDETTTRLKRGGLKFPDDKPKPRKTDSMVTQPAPKTNGSAPHEAPKETPFAAIRQKLNAAIQLLSEIEVLAGELEKEGSKLHNLRELLKGI